MIYDGEDGVFSISKGESHDQIHSYLLEGLDVWRDCDPIEWGFLSVSDNLVLLTGSAAFDVISDPIIHCWPLIDLLCFSDCFVSARMSGCHMIVGVHHDGSQEFIGWFFQGDNGSDTGWGNHRNFLVVVFTLIYSRWL